MKRRMTPGNAVFGEVKIPVLCIFFITGFIISQPAAGQVADRPGKWTLAQCLRYASNNNIQVSTLRLNEQSAAQDLTAEKGLKIPGLSGTVTNTFNNANNNINGGLVNQLTTGGAYAVNSSIILWNDHTINNTIRQRELLTQSAQLSTQQMVNDLTLLIVQDYLNVLLAKENLAYVTDLVNTSTARVKQAELFFDQGSIAKKDLLQLQAQLASDRYLLVQTQNAIRQNILSLKQQLQLPPDSSFDVATPDTLIVAPVLRPLAEVRQAALNGFPDLKIGRIGVDVANLDIRNAKAAFKPTLSANGALGSTYISAITNATDPKTAYYTQLGNNFYQRAGLSLSVPIFSNRSNKTRLEKARIAYEAARLGLANNELVLSQAVEQAYLNAANAIQSYDAASQQFLAAAESYRIANEQFRLGAINIYDLYQQRNQYVQAVQAFTQSKYSAVLQQKIYEFYMGEPVTL